MNTYSQYYWTHDIIIPPTIDERWEYEYEFPASGVHARAYRLEPKLMYFRNPEYAEPMVKVKVTSVEIGSPSIAQMDQRACRGCFDVVGKRFFVFVTKLQ